MPKIINVRNVPNAVHSKLKARARKAGVSLSSYVLNEIRRLAKQPTLEELHRRVERRKPIKLRVSAAEIIREEREKRDEHLWNVMRANRVGDQ